jgi:hypothetical protein
MPSLSKEIHVCLPCSNILEKVHEKKNLERKKERERMGYNRSQEISLVREKERARRGYTTSLNPLSPPLSFISFPRRKLISFLLNLRPLKLIDITRSTS